MQNAAFQTTKVPVISNLTWLMAPRLRQQDMNLKAAEHEYMSSYYYNHTILCFICLSVSTTCFVLGSSSRGGSLLCEDDAMCTQITEAITGHVENIADLHRFDPLVLQPHVFIHSGCGRDPSLVSSVIHINTRTRSRRSNTQVSVLRYQYTRMTSLALWYLFHHAWIELSVAHNGALFHRETSLTESPKPRNMIANPVLGPTPMGSLRNTKL